MRRADRLVRLLAVLKREGTATAQTLGAALGVSERTVYRDVADLVAQGVPVRGEAGVGYRLDARAELPPVSLDAEEIAALVLGARLVERWADSDLQAAARSSLVKLKHALPPELGRRMERVSLYADPLPPEAPPGHLGPLRHAVSVRRAVWFAYRDAAGRDTQREVLPLTLLFWGRHWSMAGWCELRSDYRHFLLARMRDVRVLDRTFPDEAPLRVQDYRQADSCHNDGSSLGDRGVRRR